MSCEQTAEEGGEAWSGTSRVDLGGSSGEGPDEAGAEPDDDEGTDDGDEPRPEPAKRACEPQAWAEGWVRESSEGPALEASRPWETDALRPVAVRWDGTAFVAYYVGVSLAGCMVGPWHGTCAVGRLGAAVRGEGSQWEPTGTTPLLDLWADESLSLKRGDVVGPETSPSGGWEAWFGVDEVEVDPHIYHARSDDGRHWELVSDSPVLGPGEAGTWDARGVSDPAVARVDGRWQMLYTGFGEVESRPQIGVVRYDHDLAAWTRSTTEPILAAGAEGRFDAWGVAAPSVLLTDGCQILFYTARASVDDRGTIGVATSTDGTTWERSDEPALRAGDAAWENAGVFDPVVWVEDGIVRLMYRGYNDLEPGGIGFAELSARR